MDNIILNSYFRKGTRSAQNFFATRKYSSLDDLRRPRLKSSHVQPGLWTATERSWFFTSARAVTAPVPAKNKYWYVLVWEKWYLNNARMYAQPQCLRLYRHL